MYQAFELKEQYRPDNGGFSGGSVSGPDGVLVDVKELLDEPGDLNAPEGVIITADPVLIDSLTAYPALKRCAKPEGWAPPKQPDDLAALTKADFAAYAEREHGIVLDANKTRPEMDADYEAALAAKEGE